MISDDAVRHYIYTATVENGRPPSAAKAATDLGLERHEVLATFGRLHEQRLLFLAAESGEIVMAPPFSAAPTPFLVTTEDQSYFANCVWDAFAIPAALHCDAEIESSCACCGEAMQLAVHNGQPTEVPGLGHFAVPAAHWWDDLVYT